MKRLRLGRTVGAAALVLATVIAAGCSDPTANTAGRKQSTLNVYLYQKPKLFSPLEPANGPDQLVMSMVFDSLVGVNDKYQLQPRVAESYKISDDAKTFTFKLRHGLKWSDGKPFTSKDVLFTYKLMADPKSTNPTVADYATVDSFEAPDDDTFVVHAKDSNAGLVTVIGMTPILPEHVLGSDPVDQVAADKFFANPKVSLGPYQFVTYRTDQYVELRANPNYRTKVKIDKIFLKPVTSDVATAQLGSGEMDLVEISPTDVATVQAMSNIQVTTSKSSGFIRAAINQTESRFADVRVRQAFLYAIDRQSIVDNVLQGKGTLRNSVFGDQWVPDDVNRYSFDPAKAKSLLAEAHWDSSKPVTLSWVAGQRDRDATATVLQDQLGKVGVKVQLKQVQVAELIDSYTKLSFDMVLFGGGNYATEPSTVRSILSCQTFYPKGGNIPHFCNKDIDSLLEKAVVTGDKAQREDLYRQAAKIENEQVAYLWLFNPDTVWAFNKRLHGFQPAGDVAPFWNAADWSVGG